MTKTPEQDKFSGLPANSHTVNIKVSGLSSTDAQALLAAFRRAIDPHAEDYKASGSALSGNHNLEVSGAALNIDKLVAALGAAAPAASPSK